MALEQMYKGMPFSPTATLTGNISATDTIIPVSDVDAFPDAPNIATIGSIAGPNETIIYTGKTTTSLTGCTRGVEGAASDWAVDELIGRNFTAKDHADMVKNIEELDNNKLDAAYKVDVVNTADVSVAGKALDARQNNPSITGTLANQIDVLSAKTLISLGAGTGYTIVSQNCYIQNEKTYINALFKRTDDSVFPTGALYIGASNSLPSGRFPGSCISYSDITNGIPSSRISTLLSVSLNNKNVSVLNTISNLRALEVSIICS